MNGPAGKNVYEDEQKPGGQKRPNWWQPAAIGALGAFAAPMPILLAVAPGLMAYLGVAGGVSMLLAAAGVCTALSWLLSGETGLWFLLAILPAAFLITAMLRKKAAYFDTALYASALSAGGLYGVYGLRDILAGHDGFHTIQETWRMMADMVVAAGVPGLTAEQLESMLRPITLNIPTVMPSVICMMGAGIGLFSVLLSRRLSARAGAPVKPMRPFIRWRVPRAAASGALVLGLGLLVCAYVLELPRMDAVISAASVVVFVPFTVQGLSLMCFLFRTRRGGGRRSPGLLLGMLALGLLVFPMGLVSILVTSCTLTGLFEQLWRSRDRFPPQG